MLTESNNTNIPSPKQSTLPNDGTKVKCGIKDHITFKMLLNEYAQRTKLPPPVYKTETVNNTAYTSVVSFNNQSYPCLAVYKRQKDAEQNAAQVALTALLGFSPEGKHFILSDSSCWVNIQYTFSGRVAYRQVSVIFMLGEI